MNFSFGNFNASPSCRTPAPTNYSHNFYPHASCSYCSNPHHQIGNCPSYGLLSNFSYEQTNTNFSSHVFESNSNFYNPNWSNHSDFLWQAHAIGNYAPQPYGCTILNIRSLIIHLSILHHTTILLNNLRWKTLSRNYKLIPHKLSKNSCK